MKVLEHVGCEVIFDERQTCCGQPAFNAGDWKEARKVAKHCQSIFSSEEEPIVCPSASCAAMLRDGYDLLFNTQCHEQNTSDSQTQRTTPNPSYAQVIEHNALSTSQRCNASTLEHAKVFELSEFLVHQLALTTWPATKPYSKRIAFHRACHSRALGLMSEAEQLLASILGVELVSFEQPEQCCGFGGAFSATEPTLSAGIGLEKLKNIQASGAEELISGDMGCLMHLSGLIEKHNLNLTTKHYAQVLAETI